MRRPARRAHRARRPGARQRIGGQPARRRHLSVPSIPSVSPGDGPDAGRASSATARPSRNSVLRPPRPAGCRADRHGGLAAGQQHAGGAAARRARAPSGRCRPSRCPSRAASPSSASPRISGAGPMRAARGRRVQRHHRRGDHPEVAVRQARRASASRRRRAASRAATAGEGVDPIAREQGARLGEGGGIGHGRAGADHRGVVARHVADRQRHHARRGGGGGEPAALDARRDACARSSSR